MTIPLIDGLLSPPNESGGGYNIPAEFYKARPALRVIRQAAHARNRSADAVLHVVLGRVAAMVDPRQRIDTGIGSTASLNLFSAIVGPPGSGKSDAWSIANELLRAPDLSDGWLADNLPLGTGEGIAEAYMGTVIEEVEKGKPVKTRQQVRANGFFFADEGEAFCRLIERSGQTLGETMRRAWKGTPLGQRNGTDERTRLVRDYAIGIVVGFQPSTIGPLLHDVSSGTPQRFIYASAMDPSISDAAPAWPGPLDWSPSFLDALQPWTIAKGISEEVRAFDLARAQGRLDVPPINAHGILTKVKVAGLLAALDKRHTVTDEDWELTSMIWRTSCNVRDSLMAEIAAAEDAKEEAHNRRIARREITVEEAKGAHSFPLAQRQAVKHVVKDECGGCKRSCITRAIAGKYRVGLSIDEVIADAVNRDYLTVSGDGTTYSAGKRAP